MSVAHDYGWIDRILDYDSFFAYVYINTVFFKLLYTNANAIK